MVASLCQTLELDTPPVIGSDFPQVQAPDTCATEAPETTINRFVAYYNGQLQKLQTEVVGALVTEMNSLFAGVSTGRVPDGLGFSAPITNLHDLEEITILNQTFLIGPSPSICK